MWSYILRRLALLPITLFFIVLVNFVVINLAPGDPVTLSSFSEGGEASRSANRDPSFKDEDPYTVFREFYGLTLPILWNAWPWISYEELRANIERLATRKENPGDTEEMSFKEYTALKTLVGDQARFVMPLLLQIASDPSSSPAMRVYAVRAFVRGGTRPAFLGPNLSESEKAWNKKISKDSLFLRDNRLSLIDSPEAMQKKIANLSAWYQENKAYYEFDPTSWQKVKIFFTETRFCKYISRVATLNFGTLRNNDQQTVIDEVVKRLKYSLTLSLIPLLITFVLCQAFGLYMALKHSRWPDLSLNIFFLVLFAIPVFVVAPFLIEKVGMNHYFPFTQIPIPLSGFTNPDQIYNQETSWQRLGDVSAHLVLPLIALLYGSLATQSRLSRTAVLEVLKQDYVRTARAKGLPSSRVYVKHVGRNAAVTIVTSVAGSLGVILGGSLIVETIFQINGFGRFFYDAILNRDYNVMMFSALAGSVLTLVGYLVADIAYMLLDPRVTFE